MIIFLLQSDRWLRWHIYNLGRQGKVLHHYLTLLLSMMYALSLNRESCSLWIELLHTVRHVKMLSVLIWMMLRFKHIVCFEDWDVALHLMDNFCIIGLRALANAELRTPGSGYVALLEDYVVAYLALEIWHYRLRNSTRWEFLKCLLYVLIYAVRGGHTCRRLLLKGSCYLCEVFTRLRFLFLWLQYELLYLRFRGNFYSVRFWTCTTYFFLSVLWLVPTVMFEYAVLLLDLRVGVSLVICLELVGY